MASECPGCGPAGKVRPRPRRAVWVALVSGLGAALAPKCPLCLAAYLSLFGVTLGAASTALALLRPLGIALCALALAVIVLRRLRGACSEGKREASSGPGPLAR